MKYRTIVADPPWAMPSGGPPSVESWQKKGRPSYLPYPTMEAREIGALPVEEMADDDAHLYLWTTNHYLERAYEITREWGFKTSQLLVWCKRPRGLGMGGAFTNTTEFIIFARRGKLVPLQRMDSTWWIWLRGPHSRKPEAFLDMVEAVSPGPYLELFARRNRLGWDTYGDECFNHVDLEVPS